MLPKDKPEVEHTPYHLISDVMLVVLGRLDHVHSVRAAQIVNMEHVVSFSHHVERIVTISLSTEAAVDVECTITIKHRPFAVFFPK